ncbi:MAG: hypothetical protein HC880_11765 [Bacteroidia bacterium]|nr:hypothetical protein [Bacteroidia bacterium]
MSTHPMRKHVGLFGFLVIIALIPLSLNMRSKDKEGEDNRLVGSELSPEFKDYWYQGKAEVSSYELEQSHYGEVHPGEAILIFVTEDFSKAAQIKLDYPDEAGSDAVSVLKLNLVKKFQTGIYDYSILQSTFTPVDVQNHPNTLKVTTSTQEWCGHTFTQLNWQKGKYKLQSHSYFESEGDQKLQIDCQPAGR